MHLQTKKGNKQNRYCMEYRQIYFCHEFKRGCRKPKKSRRKLKINYKMKKLNLFKRIVSTSKMLAVVSFTAIAFSSCQKMDMPELNENVTDNKNVSLSLPGLTGSSVKAVCNGSLWNFNTTTGVLSNEKAIGGLHNIAYYGKYYFTYFDNYTNHQLYEWSGNPLDEPVWKCSLAETNPPRVITVDEIEFDPTTGKLWTLYGSNLNRCDNINTGACVHVPVSIPSYAGRQTSLSFDKYGNLFITAVTSLSTTTRTVIQYKINKSTGAVISQTSTTLPTTTYNRVNVNMSGAFWQDNNTLYNNIYSKYYSGLNWFFINDIYKAPNGGGMTNITYNSNNVEDMTWYKPMEIIGPK